MGDDLSGARVDRADDGLRAELLGEHREDARLVDGDAVHGDLVGTGAQERARVGEAGDSATDRERDLELRRRPLDEPERRPASLEGRGHVEEDELVGAELRVAVGELDRVADVAKPLEANAFHDAAARDVEARDHALLDHASAFASTRAPAAALRSGWNWTPAIAAVATAATTGPPWSVTAATTPSSAGMPANECAK